MNAEHERGDGTPDARTPEARTLEARTPDARTPDARTPDTDILSTLIDWHEAGHAVRLVTVTSTWGSSPRPPGSMAVVRGDGAVAGSVSGGCIERQLAEARAGGRASSLRMTVGDEDARRVGLTCGGRLELVFEAVADAAPFRRIVEAVATRRRVVRESDVEAGTATVRDATRADVFGWDGQRLVRVFGPDWRVLLVGGGELSRHVARFATELDFDVVVCEPRAPFRAAFDVAGVELVDELPDDAVAARAADARSAVLALTHEPSLDDLALEEALGADCFHVGALGSRRSHARRLERLTALGVDPAVFARISAPVGLDIGSRTAAEIAISIVAELVRVRAAARAATVPAGGLADEDRNAGAAEGD